MVFLKKHYQLKLMILKSKKIVYGASKISFLLPYDLIYWFICLATLWSSPLLRSFLLEVVISWIHCPPGLDVVIVNRQLGKIWSFMNLINLCFFFLIKESSLTYRLILTSYSSCFCVCMSFSGCLTTTLSGLIPELFECRKILIKISYTFIFFFFFYQQNEWIHGRFKVCD